MVFRKYISINEMRLRMHKYQTNKQKITKSHILWQYQREKVISVCVLGVKKCSLFPLTSPKKLGTVGRHNFFFLINFFLKKVTHF